MENDLGIPVATPVRIFIHFAATAFTTPCLLEITLGKLVLFNAVLVALYYTFFYTNRQAVMLIQG